MEQTWRWFGPNDTIPLEHLKQAGATGVVTALHDIPYGVVWSPEAIAERKRMIEANPALGLRWSVVESLPVHERIKIGEGDLTELFENYRISMRNLAAAGIHTICYNFMPVLDWTRTELAHRLAGGATALRFNAHEFAAFDVFMLEREGAEKDHSPEVLEKARVWFESTTEADRQELLANIMAGLPGAYDRYSIPELKVALARYDGIDRDKLRANLARFLAEIIPTAEEIGIRMAIHPDDPPRSLMGLPRIVSSAEDIEFILNAVPSPANGLTLCAGSLGAGAQNDVPAIARRFAPRIFFAHLRNVAKEADGSFMEADHLGGDTDMVDLVTALIEEENRRKTDGAVDWRIPMRPDHGQELFDDAARGSHPGYTAVGRMKGLAELRGIMHAVSTIRGLAI